jgi:Na+/proline symporter
VFSTPDYVVFGFSLGIPVAIGLFFFFYKRKQNTVENFLLGERSINFVAVALSILAALINGVFVIGVPAEVHYYGIEMALIVVGLFISIVFASHLYVPKYQKMFFTSAYEVVLRFFSCTLSTVIMQMRKKPLQTSCQWFFLVNFANTHVRGRRHRVLCA